MPRKSLTGGAKRATNSRAILTSSRQIEKIAAMLEGKVPSATPKYMIGTVTRRTGLSVDVIRVWERRYRAITPERSEGGTRLYSDADVARLKKLKRAVELGHSIGQATRLSADELEELIAEDKETVVIQEDDVYSGPRKRFLDAIEAMDVVTAEKELTLAGTLYPSGELVKKVISPILHEVGRRWSHREFGIAHEHIATSLIRGLLSSLLRLHSTSNNGSSIVMATLADERHEFGLLSAALLAAAKGWRVIYLGADVPAPELALTIRLTGAGVLAISIPTSQSRTDAELDTLSRMLPPSVQVWIGGADAPLHGSFLERANWLLIPDLDELDQRL